MLSHEENELLTQTGPGTPCGELMRRYWQPAALSVNCSVAGSKRAIFCTGSAERVTLIIPSRPALMPWGREGWVGGFEVRKAAVAGSNIPRLFWPKARVPDAPVRRYGGRLCLNTRAG